MERPLEPQFGCGKPKKPHSIRTFPKGMQITAGRGAFSHGEGCISRGRDASQNYLDYLAVQSDYYSKIKSESILGGFL